MPERMGREPAVATFVVAVAVAAAAVALAVGDGTLPVLWLVRFY